MPTVSTYVDVDVDLEEFSDEDLLDELDRRGLGAETSGDTSNTELIKEIYYKRRLGKDFSRDLDELIYSVTGRIL